MALGKDLHAAMLKHEYEATMDDPEYQDAVLELNSRPPAPIVTLRPGAVAGRIRRHRAGVHGRPRACLRVVGPHEFMGTGPEAHFDISDRLGEITVPTLILCGWYDELTPTRCHRPLANGIADNEFVVFGNSSHLTILEKEADLYLAVIRDFLRGRT